MENENLNNVLLDNFIYDDIDKEMQHEMEESLKVAECKEGGIDA